MVLAAIGARWVAPADPQALHLDSLLAGSSRTHVLGTDQLGRDVLSRIVYGARWSLGGALLVTALITVVGTVVGAVCGYARGIVDAVVMRLVDSLLAFPTLLLALAIVAVVGPGLGGVLLGLASVGWAGYARVVRGVVLSLRQQEYVTASRATGASTRYILVHHILPNVMSPVVVLATLEIGQLVLALAGLSFLGLGARSPTPEWGQMLNEGRDYLFRAPRLMVYPGVAITLAVMGFNTLGDQLRDILDPRSGPIGRHRARGVAAGDGTLQGAPLNERGPRMTTLAKRGAVLVVAAALALGAGAACGKDRNAGTGSTTTTMDEIHR